jgi:hypothetical protein
MFDYKAGEKFKITLIMVGLAGVMAGMFFTLLLMPTPEPAHHRKKPNWSMDPDMTGQAPRMPAASSMAQQAVQQQQQQQQASAGAAQAQSQYGAVDATTGLNLVENWLPLAWDMSAGTAKQSQERAIQYMTTECALAYRQNVWTDEIAKQIEASGLQSSFRPTVVKAGEQQSDGSIVVDVEGQQVLRVPGKGDRVRTVKLEYLLKQTPDGIRIAGISENGKSG